MYFGREVFEKSAPWLLSGKKTHLQKQMWVKSLGQEDHLKKEITIHSSILASEIPWQRSLGATVYGIVKESETI